MCPTPFLPCTEVTSADGPDDSPPTTSPPAAHPTHGRHLVCGSLARTAGVVAWGPGWRMARHVAACCASCTRSPPRSCPWPGSPAPRHVAAFPRVLHPAHATLVLRPPRLFSPLPAFVHPFLLLAQDSLSHPIHHFLPPSTCMQTKRIDSHGRCKLRSRGYKN